MLLKIFITLVFLSIVTSVAGQINVTLELESEYKYIKVEDKVVVNLGDNSTVLDAMRLAAQSNDCFGYAGYFDDKMQMGCLITKICNIEQNKPLYWIVFVNGKQVDRGVSTCGIKENDVITFRYGSTFPNQSYPCAFIGTMDPNEKCTSDNFVKDQPSKSDALTALTVTILLCAVLTQLL